MRAPIAFTYGNCVFADGMADAWAAFAVEVSSYQWLSEDGKRRRFLAILGALEAIEADVQILRVEARQDVLRYACQLEAAPDAAGRQHMRARARYVEQHVNRLAELGSPRPAVFIVVSLRDPERDVATYVSRVAEQGAGDLWRALRGVFSVRERLSLIHISEP